MTYPDLPTAVTNAMANIAMRQRHDFWHTVRDRDTWNDLTSDERDTFTGSGWSAPRFSDEPGAGLDFLGMHRGMIEHVNHLLSLANDPNWPVVTPWNPIPWDSADSDWPVPPSWAGLPDAFVWAKSSVSVARMQNIAQTVTDAEWLRSRSLDEVGIVLENTIHGWMHLRWSAEPAVSLDSDDPQNDFLGAPFSSHVNKHFWKLHGWIDARISDWEIANSAQADFSNAWIGPGVHMMEVFVGSDVSASAIRNIQNRLMFSINMSLVEKMIVE